MQTKTTTHVVDNYPLKKQYIVQIEAKSYEDAKNLKASIEAYLTNQEVTILEEDLEEPC